MKKLILPLMLLTFCGLLAAEKYQIVDVQYNISGRTKEYPLSQALDIHKDEVYESREDFDLYIDYLTQKLTDQRVLQNSDITYTLGAPDERGIVPVTLHISATDTWNLIFLPYPKYDSNSGFSLKFKLKDYNFFGTMEPMDFDIAFSQEDEGQKNILGLGADFTIPFAMGIFDARWNTNGSISYTIGDSKPEFSFNTGINISYPLRFISFQLEAIQSANMDNDYRDSGDEIYGTEYLKFSTPISIFETTGILGDMEVSPYISFNYNWDLDGIRHEDLLDPAVQIGYDFSLGTVNWIGNFRRGFTASLAHHYNYNVGIHSWSTAFSIDVQGFYSLSRIGVATRAKFLSHFDVFSGTHTDSTNIAENLRGVFNDEIYNSGRAQIPSGFVLNLDIPIQILQTDWRGWGKALFKRDMPAFLGYIDFELHLSPFIDIALYKADDYCPFHIEDGFYAAGVELIVYPSRMRSIQVRASVGFDVGAYLFNHDWRTKKGPEIEIGIGLFY